MPSGLIAMTVIVTVASVVTVRPQLPSRPMHAVVKVWNGYCMTEMSAVTVKYVTFLTKKFLSSKDVFSFKIWQSLQLKRPVRPRPGWSGA